MNSCHLSYDNAHAVPSRSRNLGLAAAFTVSALVGIAWWGEQTHFLRIPRAVETPPTTVSFTLPPVPPDPIEDQDTPATAKVELAVPELQDLPTRPTLRSFVVPIEPPRPISNFPMTRIPAGGAGIGSGVTVLNLSQLDQGPVPKYQHQPIYPNDMKREGLSGEVLVDFIVDPKGEVRDAKAVRSTHQGFEAAACAAVSRWKFVPGRKDLHPVYVHMQVPIVFSLSEQ